VVVGAVPANSVVRVFTAGALTVLVTVVVRAGCPMQEQAVARTPLAREPRDEMACSGLQVGSMRAAILAVGR
jgi:hypothetical protein